jgi:integrase
MAMTGLRIGALVTLRLKHLDLKELAVYQPSAEVNTKFSKSHTTFLVDLRPNWVEILVDYINWLKKQGFNAEDPLFPKMTIHQGKPHSFGSHELSKSFMSHAQMMIRIVPDAFLKAGLPRFTSHCFRHMMNKLP